MVRASWRLAVTAAVSDASWVMISVAIANPAVAASPVNTRHSAPFGDVVADAERGDGVRGEVQACPDVSGCSGVELTTASGSAEKIRSHPVSVITSHAVATASAITTPVAGGGTRRPVTPVPANSRRIGP